MIYCIMQIKFFVVLHSWWFAVPSDISPVHEEFLWRRSLGLHTLSFPSSENVFILFSFLQLIFLNGLFGGDRFFQSFKHVCYFLLASMFSNRKLVIIIIILVCGNFHFSLTACMILLWLQVFGDFVLFYF